MNPRLAISGTEYPHRPLHELLDAAEHLRVKYLELWIPHNFRFEELPSVALELDRRGLKAAVISTWTQLNLPGDIRLRQDLITQSIRAATALGAPSVNTYFGANPNLTSEDAISHYAEAIAPCLAIAREAGVFITLENEFETTGTDITRRAHLIKRLFEQIDSPSFRLNFDPCNFYFAGEEPYPHAYTLLKDFIGYVHVKNGTKFCPGLHPVPEEGFLWKDLSGEYVCCHLSQGAIPLERLIHDILASGFDGFFGLEPHVPPGRLLQAFEESVSFMKRSLSHFSKGELQ